MARLKKTELIDELNKLGISFTDGMTYNDLQKLYSKSMEAKEVYDTMISDVDEVIEQHIKKEEPIIELVIKEVYTYIPKENEKLVMDKPSQPLIKTDKGIYESFINNRLPFVIKYKNNTVFDSSSYPITQLKAYDTFYEVYGLRYSYQGSSIIKK